MIVIYIALGILLALFILCFLPQILELVLVLCGIAIAFGMFVVSIPFRVVGLLNRGASAPVPVPPTQPPDEPFSGLSILKWMGIGVLIIVIAITRNEMLDNAEKVKVATAAAAKQQADESAQRRAAAESLALEQKRVDALIAQLEARYPEINPAASQYNQKLVDAIEVRRRANEKQGLSSYIAIQRAVEYELQTQAPAPLYQRDHKGDANIQWNNDRFGVATEKSERLEKVRQKSEMLRYESMERAGAIEKAARMEMTAKLEKEMLEKEMLEKEMLEKERPEREKLEKERLKNNADWLEKERADYKNRSF